MDGNQKGSSLFVGNLSMFIKEEDIESLFDQYSIESEFGSERIFAKIIRTEFGISRGEIDYRI
jgi:RNA recognition motif-containing protein